MTDALAAAEAAKYTKVWDHDVYRKVSPGEMEAEQAWEFMDPVPGATLNDYGSGPARATRWFADRGLDALGIDIAPNAAETDVPIIVACLWDMGAVREAEFGFCCDVLEHIPPEKLDAVMKGIRDRTLRGAWFRIATRPDVMGPKLLGEPLHLSVYPEEWWRAILERHWRRVVPIRSNGRDAVFWCRR